MRYLTADKIYSCTPEDIDGKVIVLADSGEIADIIASDLVEEGKVEHFNGILCPGFINTHCHLELSHLKNKIKEETGIGGFIGEINA